MSAVVSSELEKDKSSGAISKFLGFTTALLGVVWALLQYFIPDPMIYLYSLWRPEYVLALIGLLITIFSVSLFIYSYLKNKIFFFSACLLIYCVSSFSFFIMGREYYDPNIADGLPKITLENGSLFHRGIEFSHQMCDRVGDTIACNIKVINKRGQAEISTRGWKIVMQDGAVFDDFKAFRAGQKMRYGKLDLPQGVEAKMRVIFYNVPFDYSEILKLGFRTNNVEFGFKNITIMNET